MSDRDLRDHRPTDAARRRADEAGVDLEELRREDPRRYMMWNAEEVVRVDAPLASYVAQTLSILFPASEIFRLEAGGKVSFRVFPPAAPGDLERVEDAMARLATAAPHENAMFRVVEDLRGQRRELLVPIAPDAWDGREGVVGPFADEGAAARWSDQRVRKPLLGDPFPHEGWWFVDVFAGDDDLTRLGA